MESPRNEHKKYINFTGGEAKLNLEAIANDAKWEGILDS
jgi:hypothetical protein